MDFNVNACMTKWVVTSGTGVIGATGQPVYMQGMLACGASSQTVALYSGTTTVTMALITMTGKAFLPFPMAFPGGATYQTVGNPADADIKLIFFWVPGQAT